MKNNFLITHSIIGIIITLLLNYNFGLGGVIASSVMGLFAGFLFEEYKNISFSASFVGMCSLSLLLSPLLGIIAGIILFFYWKIFEDKFEGVGGKLGTLALITSLTLGILIFTVSYPFYPFELINLNLWAELNVLNMFLIIFFSVISVITTLFIRNKITDDSVIASSITGLISGITLPPILSVTAYTASFAGMSTKKILKDYKSAGIIGILVGLIFILLYPIFPGFGGKLGFISLLSIIIYKKIKW